MKRPYSRDSDSTHMSNSGKRPTMSRSTKKLVIKNFQPRCESGSLDFEKSWGILEDSVLKIQQKHRTEMGREELYRIVEVLCLDNFGPEIYIRIVKLFNDYLQSKLTDLLNQCDSSNHIRFLVELDSFWSEYCQQLCMIQNVFTYLDRTYVLQNTALTALWDAGLHAFRVLIIESQKINQNIYSFVLRTIQAERQGEAVDRPLLKSVIRMFITLQIYDEVFEPKLIKVTEEFYKEESQAKIEELEIGTYLRHVSQRLDEEQQRVNYYLNGNSWDGLSGCVDRCFVGDYVEAILLKGADKLFAENKIEDIKLLYRLFGRVKNARLNLKNAFVAYIKKIGRAMISNVDKDKTLVKDLMEMKSKLDQTISVCFESNEKLHKPKEMHLITSSMLEPTSQQNSLVISFVLTSKHEVLAKFMDSKLRLGNKECSEDELDVIMDRVIILFRFVDGKDYFEAFYKKALAKRLLMGRSASVDAEKSMLQKLKNECGSGFTQKLEGMFKDMETSKDLSITFDNYLTVNYPKLSHIEFGVCVLTSGNWPAYPTMQIKIPRELKEQQEVFTKFYTSKHNGRQLQWQYSIATAILKATFTPKVKKELEVSMFQALVLLCFNEKPELLFAEIQTVTQIEATELKRILQSLACGKFRVLNKEPRGREISADDKFIFNDTFNDRLYRIRISQVLLKETEAEHKETEEQVSQDRQYQIDAAIVRIMKTRKTLSHNLLLAELINQLRFATKPVDLKKRIESLIEREYMQRDKQDCQLYNYIA